MRSKTKPKAKSSTRRSVPKKTYFTTMLSSLASEVKTLRKLYDELSSSM